MKNLQPGATALLGEGKSRRRNRCAGMNHRIEVGVIEFEQVTADRVDECGMQDIKALGPSEHGGLRRAGKRCDELEQVIHGGMACRSERSADQVQDRPFRVMPDPRGNIAPLRGDNKLCPTRGYRTFRRT